MTYGPIDCLRVLSTVSFGSCCSVSTSVLVAVLRVTLM